MCRIFGGALRARLGYSAATSFGYDSFVQRSFVCSKKNFVLTAKLPLTVQGLPLIGLWAHFGVPKAIHKDYLDP